MRFLRSDDALAAAVKQSHTPKIVQVHLDVDAQDLVGYLAEFDLTLSDIAPHQAAMFVAARNAAHHVRGLEVPIGTRRREENDAAMTERPADRTLDLTSYDSESLESHLPADEMDVTVTGGVEDLSRIFPVQWLLEEVHPELFWVKLAQRELLMPEWQRPGDKPRDSADEAPQRELAPEQAVAFSAKQHAYVLLDTSSTMQDHDRRGTIARGLALEFLRAGHQQRAQLHLRPFAVEVGPLRSGVSREDFRGIARTLISLPNSGQTRIQTALEQAVLDIRSEGPCLGASILLITDGISRLARNPLAEETLHTFILGDLFEDQAGAGTIATLKSWSDTFHRIWGSHFAEILAPIWPDCQAAALVLQTAIDNRDENSSGLDAGKLDRLLENVKFLVREFRRSLEKGAPLPAELPELEKRLANVEIMLKVTRAQTALVKDAKGAAPCAEEGPHARGIFPDDADTNEHLRRSWRPWLPGAGGRQGSNTWRWAVMLWRRLKRLVLGAWNWGRERCRAFSRRRDR